MKQQRSLLLLSGPSPLDLSENILGTSLGLDTSLAKDVPQSLGDDITDFASIKGGESFSRLGKRGRKRSVKGSLLGHSNDKNGLNSGQLMAIKHEGDNGKDVTKGKIMDIRPESGQIRAMAKATPKAPKTPADYSEKTHKFYAEADDVKAIKELAALNKKEGRRHQSVSALIANELRKMLRVNAARLRRAGVKLPGDLFTK